ARSDFRRVTETDNSMVDDIAASRALAIDIADIIAETPAIDTRVIDIHELTAIADVFVICSGENERQLRAIVRSLTDDMAKQDIGPRRVEGDAASGWVLMDFGDVIVHAFD